MCYEVDIVNIDSLKANRTNVSTPLSTGKKSHPSFSGHVLTQDSRGNDIYKFNLPNAPKGTKLYVTVLQRDADGFFKLQRNDSKKNKDGTYLNEDCYDVPEGFGSVVLKASDYKLDANHILGYRFAVNGREYTDKGAKADGNYTMAIPVTHSNSTRPRQMEHVLVDSFNVKTPSYAKRNHFNMLGGTLVSMNDKIDELAQAGVRNILGTPIFGQDNKSSHGYWTTNPYQITNNLGSYKDFRNLMLNLYAHGMSWTADGAFVNEGIEGIHIKDIINWGVDSPFVPMFETKDLANVPVRFGILSKNEEVNKHIHIKLVNAPYRIVYEKTADGYKEKEIKHSTVDNSKPTYIQVFDDRLASEEQMNNNEIFDVYDLKESGDNFEIANYKDSVQAYHARVDLPSVEANYKKYKELKHSDKSIEFKDTLTKWPNFKLVKSNKDGGVSLWVGNSDISKKRFVLSESSVNEIKATPEKREALLVSPYQVQDDTVQVGKFWTSEVARMLTEYTASELSQKLGDKRDFNSFKSAVEQLVAEGKLHKGAKDVFKAEENGGVSPLQNLLTISQITGNRKYKLKQTTMPQNVTDGLMSFPLDAIEFSPDLMGVLAYPYIKNMAVSADTIGMTRYQTFQMGNDYYDMIPTEYRNLYQKMDLIYANDMTDKAMDILGKVAEKTGKVLFENGELTQEGKEIYSVISPDVAKFLFVSAIAPQVQLKDNNEMLEYDLNELHSIDLNKLGLQYEVSPKDTATALISLIKNGIKNIPVQNEDKFVNLLAARINKLDSDTINVAKLIIEKTESGLDWRIDAAKDVADWEAHEAGKISTDKNKGVIFDFWSKFNKGVRQYNPRSYTIGELTDMDGQMHISEFLDKAGFSTVSDYSYFYDSLPSMYGQNDKGNGGGLSNVSGKLKGDGSYFDSGILDALNFAHRFVGNQDKPRILHLLAMDVAAFNKDKAIEVARVLGNGIKSTAEYNELSDSQKGAIFAAIEKLKNGNYTYNGQARKFDSENFGVRPFDYSLDDIIRQAAYDNEDFRNYVNGNKDKIKKLKANALKNILEPAMTKYRSIAFAMAALPGNPTNYAGDEFGMTGWETFCKNEKQENRNAIRWDWLNDDDYSFVKTYKKTIADVMNIRNKEAASALVNGTSIPFADQNVNGGGVAFALYRYNDKTDAIAILHSHGYDRMPEHRGLDVSIPYINLEGISDNGLPVGTIYVDALNPDNKFKVVNSKVIKRIDANGNEQNDIPLGNAGIILLREKDFKGNKLSFKGRVENPYVKLANTKYNLNNISK